MPSAVKTSTNPAFIARQPQQQRAKARVDVVLQTAEALLLDVGLTGFSIPVLAERLQCPRATIYKFFPTPHAVLNELAKRQMDALEVFLLGYSEGLTNTRDWQDMVTRMVNAASDFYRTHPAAQIVLLSGSVSDASFRAFESTISRLGKLARLLLRQKGVDVPSGNPDVAALAVEFGTASFRMSYFLHGGMTSEYTQAAADVMIAFLAKRMNLATKRSIDI